MKKYLDSAIGSNGAALDGAQVTVYLTGTTDQALIYSDDGVTLAANPITTDARGYFEFYAANGVYDLKVSKSGFGEVTWVGISIQDVEVIGAPADGDTMIYNAAAGKFQPRKPDVVVSAAPDNGDTLIYSSALQKYVPTVPATGGGGATNSYIAVTGLDTPAVAAGDRAMAFGDSATAAGQYAVVVGESSEGSAQQAIAIGSNATASAFSATAIGSTAQATADDATAIGRFAVAAFANSTALGRDSATTAEDQIMLGTAAEQVVVPGSLLVGSALLDPGAEYTDIVVDGERTMRFRNDGTTQARNALVESESTLINSAGTVTLDAINGNLYTITLSAIATFVFTLPAWASGNAVFSFTIEVTNSGGARTITWPASVKWPLPGTAPTPTAGVDVYTFYTRDNGTTYRGAMVSYPS